MKMKNLMDRRASGTGPASDPVLSDYRGHLQKLRIGRSVLDIGCRDGSLYRLLPPETLYVGVDPFPDNPGPGVIQAKIESYNPGRQFDTLIAFAVLDGVEDLALALKAMNHLAKINIGLLTGMEIEPDKYHTFKITLSTLLDGLPDFDLHYDKELKPKVFLLDFWRRGAV
jgi:2-polyprenyl-3-methyl-5-hydroxy-6-metoxy-1,4-benzoquinol methylase